MNKKRRNIFDTFLSRYLLVAALVFVILVPSKASALTVTPRLDINTSPGEIARDTFRVQNEQLQSQTYYLSFANFTTVDETGNPSFTSEKEDLATWITAPESVTLGPKESKDVPFSIKIPVNASPGGHFAAIFLQSLPPSESSTTQVAIASKLGVLLLLRVDGEFNQNADVLEFGTKKRQRLFSSLPVTFYYRFQNTGDDHVKPLGDIVINNSIGRASKVLPANPGDGSVLPKSIRRYESPWVESGKPFNEKLWEKIPEAPKPFWEAAKYQWHNFAFGRYKAELSVVYGTKELKSTSDSFTFFIFPWQLLSIAIPTTIITLLIAWILLKRYNRYIINKASRSKKSKS